MDRDDEHDFSVHADASGQAQMPVLGRGVQHNTFAGGHANPDVVLVVAHERECVDLLPGRTCVLSLEITNRSNRSRRLTLRPIGVPSAVCRITPSSVLVRPNDTAHAKVALQARAAMPEAGERELSIEAVDADTGGGAASRWHSNRKRLRVQARPDLTLNVARPPARDGDSQTYRTTVTVANTGNTRLSGTVEAPSILWIMTNTTVDPGRRFVDASLVQVPGEFELGPGTSVEIPVSITFPEPVAADQRFDLLLHVRTGRSGVEDRLCSIPLVQVGSAEPVTEVEPAPPAPEGPAWRRGAAMMAAFGAVLLAAGGGVIVGWSAHPDRARPSSAPSSSASSPPTTPWPTPEADVEPDYLPMSCEPGEWVVFLSADRDADADRHAAESVRFENRRADWVDPGHTYDIKAARWDDACPRARAYTKTADPAWRFVWTGPFESRQEAEQTCAALKKPSTYDCFPRPTA